jgi:plasmid replication initiation protein
MTQWRFGVVTLINWLVTEEGQPLIKLGNLLEQQLAELSQGISSDNTAVVAHIPRRSTDNSKPTFTHQKQQDQTCNFFVCDVSGYTFKDNGTSMEVPIFTLSTKPDLSIWRWVNKDETKSIKITPSVLGRATQHDKDVLIYIISQLTEALNRGRKDAKTRVVRFTVYDYLVKTNKPTGGIEYQRLKAALERLCGTIIATNIKAGGQRIKEGFGIIDKWKIIENPVNDERMIAVEVILSEWLYNAIQAREVLTINREYFHLRKSLERRLYELARKHCGQQTSWKISLRLLQNKCGSKSALKEFRRAIREIIAGDTIPDYRLSFGCTKNQVVVTYTQKTKARRTSII